MTRNVCKPKKQWLKKAGLPAALMSASMLTGCSFFLPWKTPVTVMCSEPDALIIVNGNRVSHGESVRVLRHKTVGIMASKPGYHPASYNIRTKMSGYGTLDLIGGVIILFPLLGLIAPGAWELDKTAVTLHLEPLQDK